MLESFSCASNIKAFTTGPSCCLTLKQCVVILGEHCEQDYRSTLQSDIHTFLPSMTNIALEQKKIMVHLLELDIYQVIIQHASALCQKLPEWAPTVHGTIHVQHKVGGLQYTSYTMRPRNSTIFYQSQVGSDLQPGVIHQIFTMHSQDGTMQWVFFAIHPYLTPGEADHMQTFKHFSKFSAEIWSRTYSSQVEIIPIS